MGNIKAAIRANLYLVQILIGIAAFVCAVLVALGIITQEMIAGVVAATLSLYVLFTGALARMNITPDE